MCIKSTYYIEPTNWYLVVQLSIQENIYDFGFKDDRLRNKQYGNADWQINRKMQLMFCQAQYPYNLYEYKDTDLDKTDWIFLNMSTNGLIFF